MADKELGALQAKLVKQRQEIARLTRDNEQLRAEKAALLFDLRKTKAALDQQIKERAGC